MKNFLFLIWLGFFISCQKTDETLIKENEENTKSTSTTVTVSNTTDISHIADWKLVALTGNPHISVKEATNLAIETANQMEGLEGASKRIAPVQVASIDVIQNGKKILSYTARAPQKVPFSTDLYIIHFQDNRGYALISADRRAKGIMAYNSYGKFSLETNDPIQKMLFDRIQKYIEMQRVLYETKKDSLRAVAEEEIFKQLTKEEQERFLKQNSTSKLPESEIPYCLSLPDDDSHNLEDQWVEEKDWIEKVNIPPLIKTWWEQGSPYNAKVPYECNGKKSPVGCVAMAVGQLLTYYKRPLQFKERTMHWYEMDMGRTFYSVSDIAKEDIQYLLAHLGDSDMLAMNYECEQSGSNINKAILTFKKLGYKNILLFPYRTDLAFSEMIQRR
ncbi:C10 family peptidase, partial [Capnocytophaga sp.]